MIKNKLYELAFSYKKTRLWKKLTDTHIFAVKLSDGSIGYICIMGMFNEHCALALYVGDESFNSWQALYNNPYVRLSTDMMHEQFFLHNCLQCEFTEKGALSKEEYESAIKYVREHGLRVSGYNSYPKFVKYATECYPWYVQSEKEQEQLCEALSAAIEVSGLLEKNEEIPHLTQIHDTKKYIPLLELKDGRYIIGKTEIPEYKPYENPEPELNDLYAARLKKTRKSGVWECEIVRLPNPVQNDPDAAPGYPTLLMSVDTRSKQAFPIPTIINYTKNSVRLLNNFVEFLLESNDCPRSIKVRDERTYSFFKSLCKKTNISLSMDEDLEDMDNLLDDFWGYMNGQTDDNIDDEIYDLIESISGLSESELLSIPRALVEQLKNIAESETLPREIVDKLNKVFGWQIETAATPRIKPVSNLSYVISVSPRTGCYRHIQISGGDTLEDLSFAILDAFDFDNDHAHAFFMDNDLWSDNDCYFMRGVDDGCRTTDVTTLEQANLYKGKQFLYLFDFGDEWTFRCKVLRVEEKYTDEPVVIRGKGGSPEQYPSWE